MDYNMSDSEQLPTKHDIINFSIRTKCDLIYIRRWYRMSFISDRQDMIDFPTPEFIPDSRDDIIYHLGHSNWTIDKDRGLIISDNEIKERFHDNYLIVGDDYFANNKELCISGLLSNSNNGKLNQYDRIFLTLKSTISYFQSNGDTNYVRYMTKKYIDSILLNMRLDEKIGYLVLVLNKPGTKYNISTQLYEELYDELIHNI